MSIDWLFLLHCAHPDLFTSYHNYVRLRTLSVPPLHTNSFSYIVLIQIYSPVTTTMYVSERCLSLCYIQTVSAAPHPSSWTAALRIPSLLHAQRQTEAACPPAYKHRHTRFAIQQTPIYNTHHSPTSPPTHTSTQLSNVYGKPSDKTDSYPHPTSHTPS